MKRKVLIISVIVFLLVVGLGITLQLQQKTDHFEFPKAEEVVRNYFESWDKKNWVEMYSTFSDGFKKIEPTAKTLTDFRKYAEAQKIDGVEILFISEKSNDGKTAVVDYSVEFSSSDGSKSKFDGTFTLKFREGDIVHGWKLIHPYGNKIDAP